MPNITKSHFVYLLIAVLLIALTIRIGQVLHTLNIYANITSVGSKLIASVGQELKKDTSTQTQESTETTTIDIIEPIQNIAQEDVTFPESSEPIEVQETQYLQRLVSLYSVMSAENASRILEKLDTDKIILLLYMMDIEVASAIISNMNEEKAQDVSNALIEQILLSN